MRRLLVLFCLCLGCFIGRFSDGVPLDDELLARLEPGKTTAMQVTELLGAPQRVVELDQRSAYLYRYTKRAATGALLVVVGLYNEDIRHDRIWVFFDANDVLTHYGANFRAHRSQVAMPWVDIHDPARDARKDAKRKKRKEEAKAEAKERAQLEAQERAEEKATQEAQATPDER
ncbi:MAG: outer membrane protein assembly factor BamE domain-containing protein [Planctomycetota bacterium]